MKKLFRKILVKHQIKSNFLTDQLYKDLNWFKTISIIFDRIKIIGCIKQKSTKNN